MTAGPHDPPNQNGSIPQPGDLRDLFSSLNLKEIITAILAFGICGVTLAMVVLTFEGAGGPNFKDQKDVLLYGLSLLGAVIGYYFGRVPAELHAQQAAAQANKAQTQLQQTQAQVLQTAQTAANAISEKERLTAEYRNTLIAIKQNLQQGVNPPVASIKAARQSTGSEQAVAEIDESLKAM